jgi:nucleoside-diphosphate-sugar epimerase
MKTVVITGATSFIGVKLIQELLTGDFEIYAVVRPNSKKVGLLPASEKIYLVEADMENYSSLDQFVPKPCNAFVHLAWNGTRGTNRMDATMQEHNYQCSMKALDAVLRLGCSTVISAGSQAEYGAYNCPISEETPCIPNTEYGKWKLKFYEDAFSLCNKNGIHFKEPRFFSLYGPDDFEGTMIISILRKMLKNEDCQLTACKQMWNYIYITDAVQGVKKIIELDCADGAYNFGSGIAKPLKEYVEEMARIANSQSHLLYGSVPYPTTGMVSIEPVIGKLVKETKWHPRVTFEQGVSCIIEVLRCGEE